MSYDNAQAASAYALMQFLEKTPGNPGIYDDSP